MASASERRRTRRPEAAGGSRRPEREPQRVRRLATPRPHEFVARLSQLTFLSLEACTTFVKILRGLCSRLTRCQDGPPTGAMSIYYLQLPFPSNAIRAQRRGFFQLDTLRVVQSNQRVCPQRCTTHRRFCHTTSKSS